MTYEKRKLTSLRESRFESQGQAAAAIGVSQATLSRWEAGEAEPNSEYRGDYARALGIAVEELGRIIYGRRVSTVQVNRQRRAGVAQDGG